MGDLITNSNSSLVSTHNPVFTLQTMSELGHRLVGRDVTISLDPTGTASPRRQLEMVPVVLLQSENVYQPGSLIAANSAFICYVVKRTLFPNFYDLSHHLIRYSCRNND